MEIFKRSDDPAPRIALAAIFKNERPYILEWIAFHRVVGIDRFFIADNNSTDGTTSLLRALHSAGVITHIPFPGTSDQPPQLPAYAEIMRRHRKKAEWFAFIDADEFLMPTEGDRTIQPFMKRMHARRDVGAVMVNWAVYGSSGLEHESDEPVIKRFTRRAEEQWPNNQHLKSIVRSEAWSSVWKNPHIFILSDKYKAVQTNGADLVHRRNGLPGQSEKVTWSHVRLNHYVTKSKEEFFRRKMTRGRATTDLAYTERFFYGHDRNEVRDPVPAWLVEATRLEIECLRALVGAAGRGWSTFGLSQLHKRLTTLLVGSRTSS